MNCESTATAAEVAAARAYEGLHVPAMFAPFAPLVADAARLRPGQRVLDVACGTGVLAREVAGRTGEPRVVGLDPSAGMLAVARESAPACEFRQGRAEELPFGEAAFDVVVSQFGLMFCADRLRAAAEMARVLAPRGRCAVAVWAGLGTAPFFEQLVGILDREVGRAAGDALRLPFALGDAAHLAAIFEGAGFEAVGVRCERASVVFPDLRTLVEAELCGWLPLMGVRASEAQMAAVHDAAEHDLTEFVDGQGRLAFHLEALVATGERGR